MPFSCPNPAQFWGNACCWHITTSGKTWGRHTCISIMQILITNFQTLLAFKSAHFALSDQSVLLQGTVGFIQLPGTPSTMLCWLLGRQSPNHEPGSGGNKIWVFFQSVKVKKAQNVESFCARSSGTNKWLCSMWCQLLPRGSHTGHSFVQNKNASLLKMYYFIKLQKKLLERGRWKIRFYSLLKGWAAVYQTLCTSTNTHISLLQISCSLHS